MSKIIRSIQFLSDKVIVDYGNDNIFQFCKACKDGKHFKSFLNYFSPQINLSLLEQTETIIFEKRFYYNLSRGAPRRLVNRVAHEFAEYLEDRCERTLQKKPKQPPTD